MTGRTPREPEYPEIQTEEQFANALLKACVEGHHIRMEPLTVALKLWKWVGEHVDISSDMPDDMLSGYKSLYGEEHPKQVAGGMLLTEVYFDVVNHSTYVYALSDEGWALMVTNNNLTLQEPPQ